MTSFAIARLTDHLGAEVRGLDCSKPVDPQIRDRLNQAFIDHHVLVVRDQHFTPAQFKSAAQLFGELQPHDKKEHHVSGHPDVSYVSNDEFVNGRRIIPGEISHRSLQSSATAESDHAIRDCPAVARRRYAIRQYAQGL